MLDRKVYSILITETTTRYIRSADIDTQNIADRMKQLWVILTQQLSLAQRSVGRAGGFADVSRVSGRVL